MNSNLWRTILSVAAVAIGLLVPFLGCTADAVTGATDCHATWVPAPWNLMIAPFLMAVGVVIKAFGGTGTVSQNLTKPAVPVVPAADAKPGVVTSAQVAAH